MMGRERGAWRAAAVAPLFLATVLVPVLAASARTPPSGDAAPAAPNGNVSGFRENQPSAATVQGRESAAGIRNGHADAEDRELDAIGKQLLAGTPKSPAGTTSATGGGATR